MLIVGVTGGVASGKTTVSRMFEKEGAYLIDADRIARELVEPRRPAWRELARAFGKEVLQEDGAIDRKRLGEIAFSNSGKRRLLNRILHPRIEREMEKKARQIERKDPHAIVVFDVPLLVETGFHQKVDRVVVVTSKKTQQIERLRKRAGRTRDETQRIISSQMALEKKVKVADFIIRNEGSLDATRRRVREVFQTLRKIALQKRMETTDKQ
jgi:dephospho-CoA kinase